MKILKSLKLKIFLSVFAFLILWFLYLGPAADRYISILQHFEKIPSDIEVVDDYPILIFKMKSLPRLLRESKYREVTDNKDPAILGMYSETLTELKFKPLDSHRLYVRTKPQEKEIQLLIHDEETDLIYSQVWSTE